MKATNAQEFIEVWSAEVNRAGILWNSLPKRYNEGFHEFLDTYKEFIGIALFDTYGKEAVVDLLDRGVITPEDIGMTSMGDMTPDMAEVYDRFSEASDEELKAMIASKERFDRKKINPPDQHSKSGVVR